jgi:glycosyltransferase involved in cell wall biosynthesis
LKVTFLATYPVDAAATRYRCVQYFPFLRANGIECELRPFLPADLFRRFYGGGPRAITAFRLGLAAVRRLLEMPALRRSDVVFVQREAALFGPPVVEWAVARLLRKPVVFDLDDSIHLSYVSPTYGRLATWLKHPRKTSFNLRSAVEVIAGNPRLAEHARQYNPNVTVIPTVVDAALFSPATGRNPEPTPAVGWIGSPTTTRYLNLAVPALRRLHQERKFRLRVVGADSSFCGQDLPVELRDWSLDAEVGEFRALDVGIYPLPDDDWAGGKSGFKAIQYMAVGVPCVASPVGVTRDLVEDGVTGFLARTEAEWVGALSRLLDDPVLRRRQGLAGRRRVESEFCLAVQQPRLLHVIREAAAAGRLNAI